MMFTALCQKLNAKRTFSDQF